MDSQFTWGFFWELFSKGFGWWSADRGIQPLHPITNSPFLAKCIFPFPPPGFGFLNSTSTSHQHHININIHPSSSSTIKIYSLTVFINSKSQLSIYFIYSSHCFIYAKEILLRLGDYRGRDESASDTRVSWVPACVVATHHHHQQPLPLPHVSSSNG